MEKDLQNRQIARFALNATYEDIGKENVDRLKKHLLDSIGSMIYASTKPAIHKLIKQLQMIGEGGPCRVPLIGGFAKRIIMAFLPGRLVGSILYKNSSVFHQALSIPICKRG